MDSKAHEVNVISRPLLFSLLVLLAEPASVVARCCCEEAEGVLDALVANERMARLDYDVDESNLDEILCLFNQQVAQIAIYPVVKSNEKPSVDISTKNRRDLNLNRVMSGKIRNELYLSNTRTKWWSLNCIFIDIKYPTNHSPSIDVVTVRPSLCLCYRKTLLYVDFICFKG